MDVEITVFEDRKEYDLLKKRLRGLDGLSAESGLFDPEQAQKGAWHEFGSRRVPARPWAASAADASREHLAESARAAAEGVCDGLTAAKAMKPVADHGAKVLSEAITRQQIGGPPLAESTVRAKGHSRKLIDTGKMLRSIKGRVARESEGGEP